MKPSWHYYEAHVTIEPVFDERLVYLSDFVGTNWGFRVADLLMQKREEDIPDRSKYDTFCTGRSESLEDLRTRTYDMVFHLKRQGFKVWRYKIESTVIDSKYEDTFNLLETK